MPRNVNAADLLVASCQQWEEGPGRDLGRCAIFTAPQSLSTYAVAICIVATLTRAARTIARADSVLVPLAAALLVGSVMLTVIVADRRTRPRGALEWTSTLLVSVVNSLVLFTAALGIEKF